MSWSNKVIWAEGMFMRPQHFQQQTRYVENLVEGRCSVLRNSPWGFKTLQIDQQMLSLGKLSISSARGVLPDGTPFDIPHNDDPPIALEVDEGVRSTIVHLCIPARRADMTEYDDGDDPKLLARYHIEEYEARDSNASGENVSPMQVGKLRLRLLLDSEQRDDYVCMGVVRILEARADKNLVLDEGYIPPVLDCNASARVAGLLSEIQGLLHHRGDALAGRVSASGRGGAAEIADFLLLQVVNRLEPLFAHLAELDGLHPEHAYSVMLAAAGELATFTSPTKRPPAFSSYLHHDLQATFEPVMGELRQSLSMVLEQNAIAIPLEERKYGIRVAAVADHSLLDQANFVLAVSASIPTEEVRRRFPAQVKIGPVEQIRQLVNLQLSGIGVGPLAVAPRQIPYHAGNVYFELDRASELWKQLKTSGGFAVHVGGEFPGLEMEFWAIRR